MTTNTTGVWLASPTPPPSQYPSQWRIYFPGQSVSHLESEWAHGARWFQSWTQAFWPQIFIWCPLCPFLFQLKSQNLKNSDEASKRKKPRGRRQTIVCIFFLTVLFLPSGTDQWEKYGFDVRQAQLGPRALVKPLVPQILTSLVMWLKMPLTAKVSKTSRSVTADIQGR